MTCYQPLKGSFTELTGAALSVDLEDGRAELMGDGMVVVDQLDPTQPKGGEHQRVVLSDGDLERLGASRALSVALDDGRAEMLGDGLWVIDQTDDEQRGAARHQRVVLSRDDVAKLAAAVS